MVSVPSLQIAPPPWNPGFLTPFAWVVFPSNVPPLMETVPWEWMTAPPERFVVPVGIVTGLAKAAA